jgi:hypothetical protein
MPRFESSCIKLSRTSQISVESGQDEVGNYLDDSSLLPHAFDVTSSARTIDANEQRGALPSNKLGFFCFCTPPKIIRASPKWVNPLEIRDDKACRVWAPESLPCPQH